MHSALLDTQRVVLFLNSILNRGQSVCPKMAVASSTTVSVRLLNDVRLHRAKSLSKFYETKLSIAI